MGPRRIVCLTEEPTETLYLLGEQDRIVGISGFTVRPAQARREKPKVSAFISAKMDKILALKPDLAIGFSDMQADIAQYLVKAGVEVWIANHRSVEGILDYIRRLGALVGAFERADRIACAFESKIDDISRRAAGLPFKPKVYFEEWDTPQITAIRWVSELIGIAGGHDIFRQVGLAPLGRDRIIADPNEVVRLAPDIIMGSWCGKKFRPDQVAARDQWETIPAVRSNDLYEIKSPNILQPGPAALSDGLDEMESIIRGWASKRTRAH